MRKARPARRAAPPSRAGPSRSLTAAAVVSVLVATGLALLLDPVGWASALAIAWAAWMHLSLVALLTRSPRLRGAPGRGEIGRQAAGHLLAWLLLGAAAAALLLGPALVRHPDRAHDLALFAPGVLLSCVLLFAPALAVARWRVAGGRAVVVIAYPAASAWELVSATRGRPLESPLLQALVPPFSLAAELSERIRFAETAWLWERGSHLVVYLTFWTAMALAAGLRREAGLSRGRTCGSGS